MLNPCKENPEEFFTYDEMRSTIHPLPSLTTTTTRERMMAEKSISVYQLQRHELVPEREKVFLLLLAQIEYTKRTIEDYNNV